MQDSLLECIKTFEKTVQFVFEYMCIIHEKAAALPGTKTKENFHLATKHVCHTVQFFLQLTMQLLLLSDGN